MIKEILAYFKNPDYDLDPNYFNNNKFKLFITLLGLALAGSMIWAVLIMLPLESLEIVDSSAHANEDLFNNYSPLMVLLITVVLAPLIEEVIFRAPLWFFKNSSPAVFKIAFYAAAVLFAIIHVTNYEMSPLIATLALVLTIPQLITGLCLGLIRCKLGLLYSMLFHASFNGILVIPLLILKAMGMDFEL